MHLSFGLLTLMAASVTAVPGLTYDYIHPDSYTEFIRLKSPYSLHADAYNNIRAIHNDFKAWYKVCSLLAGKKLSRCFEDFVEAYRQHGRTEGRNPYRVRHGIPQLLEPERRLGHGRPGPSTIISALNRASSADKDCKSAMIHTRPDTGRFIQLLKYDHSWYKDLICKPLDSSIKDIPHQMEIRMTAAIEEMADNLADSLREKISADRHPEVLADRHPKVLTDKDNAVKLLGMVTTFGISGAYVGLE